MLFQSICLASCALYLIGAIEWDTHRTRKFLPKLVFHLADESYSHSPTELGPAIPLAAEQTHPQAADEGMERLDVKWLVEQGVEQRPALSFQRSPQKLHCPHYHV